MQSFERVSDILQKMVEHVIKKREIPSTSQAVAVAVQHPETLELSV